MTDVTYSVTWTDKTLISLTQCQNLQFMSYKGTNEHTFIHRLLNATPSFCFTQSGKNGKNHYVIIGYIPVLLLSKFFRLFKRSTDSFRNHSNHNIQCYDIISCWNGHHSRHVCYIQCISFLFQSSGLGQMCHLLQIKIVFVWPSLIRGISP